MLALGSDTMCIRETCGPYARGPIIGGDSIGDILAPSKRLVQLFRIPFPCPIIPSVRIPRSHYHLEARIAIIALPFPSIKLARLLIPINLPNPEHVHRNAMPR